MLGLILGLLLDELFELLVDHRIDMKISEQRRTFNNDYYNENLKESVSFIEISTLSPLSKKEVISADDLKNMSCIIVVSKEREDSEREFYEKSLNLSHRFLYADSLETTIIQDIFFKSSALITSFLDKPMSGIERIELSYKGNPIQRNYFACWPKDKTNYYIEEFVKMYKEILNK